MTRSPGVDRLSCGTRPIRSDLPLWIPRSSAGRRRLSLVGSNAVPRCTRAVHTARDPVPRACFDDYLGGRSDRLGVELLFDLREPVPGRVPVGSAIAINPPRVIGDVLSHVQRRHPDLVWLYPGELARARDLAQRIIDAGVETIIIVDEETIIIVDEDDPGQ